MSKDEEEVNLEGAFVSDDTGSTEVPAIEGRKYHLYVVNGNLQGDRIKVKLISSPYSSSTGLDAGTDIILDRPQYEAIRSRNYDLENDPTLSRLVKEGNITERGLQRVRAYDSERLMEFRNPLGMDLEDED